MFGIASALCATFFLCAKDIGSKALSLSISGAASSVGSFLFALPFYVVVLAFLFWQGVPVFEVTSGFWFLILARALSDAAGESFKMYALKNGELSVVSIILSFMPIMTVLVSPIITGDPFVMNGLLGAALGVAGSIIVLSKTPTSTKGVGFALGAVICMALNHCLDRLAVQQGHPVFSGFGMTLAAAVFTTPLFFFDGHPREFVTGRKILWYRGFCEVAFMVAKLTALTFLTAPAVMILLRLSLVGNIAAGLLIFKEKNAVRKIVAGLFVIAGVLIGV